jgi:hypothetical protein
MPTGASQQIVRVSTGFLNRVNDPIIGSSSTLMGPGLSRFAGMIGATVILGPNEVQYDSNIGTLYGGVYQYVRFAPAGTYPRGSTLFWDLSVAENLYQVTSVEAASGAKLLAGVSINPTAGAYAITPGNYGYICVGGKVAVQFRAVLTGVPSVGVAVYAAGAGAGADNAEADVLNNAAPATLGDAALLDARFLGWAETAPANNTISNVWLGFTRRRY